MLIQSLRSVGGLREFEVRARVGGVLIRKVFVGVTRAVAIARFYQEIKSATR